MKKFSIFFTLLFVVLLIADSSVSTAQTVVQKWDFESGLGDWQSGAGGASIEVSTDQAASDSQSVKLVKATSTLEINLQNDVYEDVQEGDIITYNIWISAVDLANVNGVQIFWQNTESWNWNAQWTNGTSLVGDQWNTVEYTFPAIEPPLQRIGFQLLMQAGNESSTPTLYVDDVTVSRPAAEFNIVIDAERDDWYNTLTGPDDGYIQLHYYTGNDNGVAKNDADLSAKMWAAWDTTWFYFYTEVKDDTISGSGANSYQDDGLELKFDPMPTSATNSIFAPNLTILGGAGSDSLNVITDSTAKQWARRITSDGYAIELAIKWDVIISGTETVPVAEDSVFGLAINIHDNDQLVGGTRVASVMWAAVMLDAVWNTPSDLGRVKFLPDHKVQFDPTNNITGVFNPIPFDETPFYLNFDGQKDRVYQVIEPGATNTGYVRLRPHAANDNGAPVNNADLSGALWTMWDDDWFYMYMDVTDDTISNGGTTNVWEVDNVELKFDPQPTDSVTNSIWDTRVTAPGMTPGDSLNNVADSVKIFSRRSRTGGYTFEIAIKWSAIQSSNGETVSVGVDSVFGLAINLHDNDGNGRQATEMWGAVLLDAAWNTPKYLGTVKFLPDHILQFIPENNMTGVRNNLPYDGTVPVGVENENSVVPTEYSLSQNYPNPFNPVTTIQFSLPENSNVRLVLYDILGREVKEIVKGEFEPGYHKVVLDGSNLATGVYFYRLDTGKFANVKKLMIVK